MDLESKMLGEISQRKINTIHFTFIWNLRNKKYRKIKIPLKYRKHTAGKMDEIGDGDEEYTYHDECRVMCRTAEHYVAQLKPI